MMLQWPKKSNRHGNVSGRTGSNQSLLRAPESASDCSRLGFCQVGVGVGGERWLNQQFDCLPEISARPRQRENDSTLSVI